jgi:hypothetical protein
MTEFERLLPKSNRIYIQIFRIQENIRMTQNPFKVNLTILGVKIGRDHKWGYYNPIQACTSLR